MTLKVGLIGCGNITRSHVEGWKAIADRAEIVAVADVVEENAKRRVEQIGRPVKIYSDYHDLLANEKIEAVDVALPHHLHCEAIVAAAGAGKHILSEKPLCISLKEADAIAKAVKDSGVVMMAAHNQLFFPPMLQAKQMIVSGDLGKIYTIHAIGGYGRRTNRLGLNKATWNKTENQPASTWRTDPQTMGGGELIDSGYHEVYRLLFLAGEKPREVAAMLGTYRRPMEREDTAEVLVKFESGMIGRVFSSWAMPAPGGRPITFCVMGEAGQIWAERDKLFHQPIDLQSPSMIEYPGWTGERAFAAEIAHFADAIEGGFEPLHSVAEATDTLRIVLAAYRSAEEGVIVKL